jgi:hypothetical protein
MRGQQERSIARREAWGRRSFGAARRRVVDRFLCLLWPVPAAEWTGLGWVLRSQGSLGEEELWRDARWKGLIASNACSGPFPLLSGREGAAGTVLCSQRGALIESDPLAAIWGIVRVGSPPLEVGLAEPVATAQGSWARCTPRASGGPAPTASCQSAPDRRLGH